MKSITNLVFISILLVFSNAFAFSGGMQGGFVGNMTNDHKVIVRQFPEGLTFYENFEAGTDIKSLTADFSIGSPNYTYTSTSGVPSFTGGGYNATTANDDVLKYAISGNRTAAQETIVIKFSPDTDFANDGVYRFLTTTGTKERFIRKLNTGTTNTFKPNGTDYSGVSGNTTTVPLSGITYIVSGVCQVSAPQATSYMNGISEGTSSTNTWNGVIGWTDWEIGCDATGTSQFDGIIKKIKVYNRKLSASEILAEYNL